MLNPSQNSQVSWIDGSSDQSITSSTWKKVESKICQALAQKLEKELLEPTQRQILFQLLGEDFVNKHFPSYTSNPALLNSMASNKKEKKISEMRSYLVSIIDMAVENKNSKSKKSKGFSEFATFREEARDVVENDYQLQEKRVMSKKNKKGIDFHEQSLKHLLYFDASMIGHLIAKFRMGSVLLSDSLRSLLWAECLSHKEKPKNKGFENFQSSKEKFLQIYLQRKDKLVDSEISSDSSMLKVTSSVRKAYKDLKSLKPLYSEWNAQCTSDIVGIYYAHRKEFGHHHIFWAVPIQQVYVKNKTVNSDGIPTAAMMVEKILRLSLPSRDQLFKMASNVIQTVEKYDPELISHIKLKLTANMPDSIKDFSNKIFFAEKKINFNDLEDGSKTLSGDLKAVICEPAIFIRKWLSEGFVSILNPNAAMFIWDQMFLNTWEIQALQNVCLLLVGLLKPWFLLANNYTKIRDVFLEEPYNLYTLDIRRAWCHIQKKGNLTDIAKMNRNINYEEQTLVLEPAELPKPLPPTPSLPPFIPWMPYKKEKAKEMIVNKTKVDAPFDLYIDSVRIVPDNATVVKVTGKIINMYLGNKDKFIKIQAFPELDSFSHYPQFKLKQVINQENIPLNPDVVIMLRVYTIERHSKKVAVLGSCLICPFSNKHGKQATLRIGGHQVRLRHGIPDPDFTIEHLLASHMDDNPVIPGLTILLRVLPHQKDYVAAPVYESGIYRSELARPNDSESRLFKHYQHSKAFKMTVRDVMLLLCGITSANDETLDRSMKQMLEKEVSTVEDFPYQRYVDYDKEMGMMVLADKASGLPIFLEGRYLQCLVQSFPGEDTKIGNGKSQVTSFITKELELESTQRSPDWSDYPSKINPLYDDKAFLLITLYGLRPRFNPETGKIVDKDGKNPVFDLHHAIAWSVVPCFDKGAVFSGTHHVPLLKGRASDDIIEKLRYLPLDYVCKKFKSQVKIFDSASVEITIWDGHFTNNECPPLPTHVDYLNISPAPRKYLLAKEQKFGVTAAQLLKDGMSGAYQFSQCRETIVTLLKQIFDDNMNEALRKAGYAKLF